MVASPEQASPLPPAPSSRSPSPVKPLPADPFPPRSSLPPPSPRKNALGLPPTYLRHLRRLLHQWLEQQTQKEEDGLPLPREGSDGETKPLWSEKRIQELENAVWNGIVIPQLGKEKRRGRNLLELDWSDWIKKAEKRKKVWKAELLQQGRAEGSSPEREDRRRKTKNTLPPSDPRHSTKATATDTDIPAAKSRLTVPSTPILRPTQSGSYTPSRSSTRSSSMSSFDSSNRRQEGRVAPKETWRDQDDEADQQKEWWQIITSLKGFEKLSLSTKDEWELIDDDLPKIGTVPRDLPGAFPQISNLDYLRRSEDRYRSTASSSQSQFSELGLPVPSPKPFISPIVDCDMVKPVFCLHFPSPPSRRSGSQSTLRLRRNDSLGASSTGSIGSTSGKKWWGGSGGRWSEMTAGPDHEEEVIPEVSFVEGRFVPPTFYSYDSQSTRKGLYKAAVRKRKSVRDAFQRSPAPSMDDTAIASDSEVDESLDDPKLSSSSEALHGSRIQNKGSLSAVIAGADNDIPVDAVANGTLGIVGGTVVIKGVTRVVERQSLEGVLRLMLYTIQIMMMELDLLDAFGVPREPDDPPVPSKHTFDGAYESRSQTKPRQSTDLVRKGSLKDRKDKTKGFLQKLGKESKLVWEGLLGRRRLSQSQDHPHSTLEPDYEVTLMTAAELGLESKEAALPSSTKLASGTPVHETRPSHPTERYLQVLSRLASLGHSTTPGLILPMPPLLLRMKEEDRIRQEKAKQEISNDKLETPDSLPQSAVSATLTPGHALDPLKGRALGYRLGGDVRAGLGALTSGLNTFSGWIRLQRLETLYCVGLDNGVFENGNRDLNICHKPKPQTFVFWDEEGDQSIEEFVRDLTEDVGEEGIICPRSGCTASETEHVRWWIHAGKKVGMKIEIIDGDGAAGTEVWVKCKQCGKTNEPRFLGDGATAYSWGKLLELLLYTNVLRPADLCSHASAADNIIHHIRTERMVLSLSAEDIPVLDTRLPKLQVGPNVPKRKSGTESITQAMEGVTRMTAKAERIEGVRKDIEDFYSSLTDRLAVLINRTKELSLETPEKTLTSTERYTHVLTLETLSAELQLAKSALLEKLSTTSSSQLNDVRRQLAQHIHMAETKIAVWQKAHNLEGALDETPLAIPEYADGRKVHALPGSSILVREDEPSSLIAYTLSSLSYFTELTHTTKTSTADDSTAAVQGDGMTTKKLEGGADGSGIDTWSVRVRRLDSPRDLLSLRTLKTKKSDAAMPPASKLALSLTPKAPSTELSLEQVEGNMSSTATIGPAGLDQKPASVHEPDSATTSSFKSPPMTVRRVTNESISSPTPPSAFRPVRSVSSTALPTPAITSASSVDAPLSKEGWGSVTSTFSNSFNQLLKLGTDVGETLGSIRVKGTERSSLSRLIGPLNLITPTDTNASPLDNRPHIEFRYTVGNKLKMSCTVYYATAFDMLRRRCAIDKSVITSLARADVWDAQGGKSKASFFMTQDERYIVKELVSKWHVSDTHALLEIAPAYFEHLAGTHNKATSLAKIVGFYNVRIDDVQNGARKQLDLLVMENLFYKQTVSKTFDLKGIESRKVSKAKSDGDEKTEAAIGSGTLFDGDWLERMQKGLVLLQPHAKRILLEAVSLDTRFLSSQSIMDYSLLLGLDETRKEVVAGLVDAIGSYNLFKTIESRGKMVINRGGEVTVIPPDQYRQRFETAIRQYFLACPDKWSKTSRRDGAGGRQGVPSIL
nr:uncharacterized protein CI109_003626 [Kwoniella shandongensis]KAA5527971.1 hypothetical protein CI109_003626 [Kwoniella shandongensis]